MIHMRWLIWPRQYGKTERVIEWWLECPENRVIVTHDEETARHHRRRAEALATDRTDIPHTFSQDLRNNIMSHRSWGSAQRGRTGKQVAFDDCVKVILSSVAGTGNELAIISDSGRVEEPDSQHANQVEFRLRQDRHLYPANFDFDGEGC